MEEDQLLNKSNIQGLLDIGPVKQKKKNQRKIVIIFLSLCRPPSGTFQTFRNLYFGWNPLKPFIWLKNL